MQGGLCRYYWVVAGVLMIGGGVVAGAHFHTDDPWLLVGLTMALMGVNLANIGYLAKRRRSLDSEFDAGVRVGYRQGRRAGKPVVVFPEFRREGDHGGISKAPIRAMAGDGPPARRSASDPHGPAEGRCEELGRGRGGIHSPRGVG